MGEVRMHDEHIVEYSAQDYFISLLTAITMGGVAGATVWGLFEGAFFGLNYFGIDLPAGGLIPLAILVAYNAFPILAGLLVTWRTYVKVLDMP